MSTMHLRLAAASVLAALCCAPVLADEGPLKSGVRYSSPDTRAPADYLNEREAVGLLETVDDSEVETARLALERSRNDDVLEYARRIIADHEDARRMIGETGIKGMGSEARRSVQDRTRMTTSRLKRLEGGAFDRAYLASQVENHQMVLEKIDQKIVPHAKTGSFATHVQDRRPVIQSHLDEARRLKSRLGTR